MDPIIKNISKHIALISTEEAYFLTKIELKKYKAKCIILNAGEICKHSYFINSGMLRSFNINDNIAEHVLSFAYLGWWIEDLTTYFRKNLATCL